jgi:hypothetical protein
MNSKRLSTIALFSGLVSLPLYGAASNFTAPIIKTLELPIPGIDLGTLFLLASGVVGLLIMRKLVR